jgi:predicted TIM-barrel fold metal-dependent hydrolase
VLVATGYPWCSEPLQVGELARRFPTVSFLATNGGQINISGLGQTDAELALARSPNLLVQTAGVYREDFLEGVAARLGPERLVFASGFPLMDPRLEIRRVQWSHLADDAQARILGGNLLALLGDG